MNKPVPAFAKRAYRAVQSRLAASRGLVRGSWDIPAGTRITTHATTVTLAGWAFLREETLTVDVLVNGAVVATVTPHHSRPDVAAVIDPTAGNSGWIHEMPLDETLENATIEVRASGASSSRSLGTRSVQILEEPTVPVRSFNALGDSVHIDVGDRVLEFTCSVLPDGRPVDFIDLHLGDDPPIRARRAVVRADLLSDRVRRIAWSDLHRTFHATIPRQAISAAHATHLQVRAVRSGAVVAHAHIDVRSYRETDPVEPARGPVATVARRERTTTRPTVCVFAHSFNLGGGELYLQDLLLRLAAADAAEIHVIGGSGGPLAGALESAGITTHELSGIPTTEAYFADYVERARALLTDIGCDVAIVSTLFQFPGACAAIDVDIPVLWILHESFPIQVGNRAFWIYDLPRAVEARQWDALERASVLVFEAYATERLYAAQLPRATSRCIRYGIDLPAVAKYRRENDRALLRSECDIAPTTRTIVCVGTFEPRKSQLAVVDAVAAIERSGSAAQDFELILVGYAPALDYSALVARAVASLGLQSRIRLVPVTADIYRWYSCADVLISVSDIESLPRSFMEAMAFGVPVASARAFGVTEVIADGVNGWLFDTNDREALIATFERVLSTSDDELRALGERAARDAAAFDSAGYAEHFGQLIRELTCEEKGGHR